VWSDIVISGRVAVPARCWMSIACTRPGAAPRRRADRQAALSGLNIKPSLLAEAIEQGEPLFQ